MIGCKAQNSRGPHAELVWHHYMAVCRVSHTYSHLAKMAEPSESEPGDSHIKFGWFATNLVQKYMWG